MSKLEYMLPLIILVACLVLAYFFADQIFMFLYDLSGLISKYL